MTRIRLPYAPLEEYVRARHQPDDPDEVLGCRRIAILVGFAGGTVHDWKKNGLTIDTADKAAVALGLHPSAIWGELWWAA